MQRFNLEIGPTITKKQYHKKPLESKESLNLSQITDLKPFYEKLSCV